MYTKSRRFTQAYKHITRHIIRLVVGRNSFLSRQKIRIINNSWNIYYQFKLCIKNFNIFEFHLLNSIKISLMLTFLASAVFIADSCLNFENYADAFCMFINEMYYELFLLGNITED